MQFIPDKGCYVYFRYNVDKTVMIVYNSNEKEAEVNLAHCKERTGNYGSAVNVISGVNNPSLDRVKVPGKTTYVYELR